MGVYIPGMEMPKSCWDCYFQDCGNCRLNGHKVVDKCIIEDRIDDDCPLVHIPPHGRLIDANAIRADIDEKRPGRSYEDAWTLTVIDAAPTIIPATVKHKEG